MEVVTSSSQHVVLQVPKFVGFMSAQPLTKSVAIINPNVLGFFDKRTLKFRPRPHASDFLLTLSRLYHLAVVSSARGLTIRSGMFGLYYLVFASEEEDLDHHLVKHDLTKSNSFIVDTSDTHENTQLGIINFPEYVRNNSKDISLHPDSPTCVFLVSIAEKSSMDIHVNVWKNN